jgi:hypothetical protein
MTDRSFEFAALVSFWVVLVVIAAFAERRRRRAWLEYNARKRREIDARRAGEP